MWQAETMECQQNSPTGNEITAGDTKWAGTPINNWQLISVITDTDIKRYIWTKYSPRYRQTICIYLRSTIGIHSSSPTDQKTQQENAKLITTYVQRISFYKGSIQVKVMHTLDVTISRPNLDLDFQVLLERNSRSSASQEKIFHVAVWEMASSNCCDAAGDTESVFEATLSPVKVAQNQEVGSLLHASIINPSHFQVDA